MLSDSVERHIALHHATGYKFRWQASVLRRFARFADARSEQFVRAQTALDWAAKGSTATTSRDRLLIVRRFARLMRAEDARHEVPPAGAFGPTTPRPTPHIYTAAQIVDLLASAAALTPHGSLRPRTYETLLALIASTGLRISEALALQLDDVTPAGLLIRATKFRKSRLVPLHDTVLHHLHSYIAARVKTGGSDPTVFVSLRGARLSYRGVLTTFRALVLSIGLLGSAGRRPRIHDLRHTFAVRSLEQCRGDRAAIARHMLALSTYLGHARVASTYWYLEATPQLLADVAEASETLATGGGA